MGVDGGPGPDLAMDARAMPPWHLQEAKSGTALRNWLQSRHVPQNVALTHVCRACHVAMAVMASWHRRSVSVMPVRQAAHTRAASPALLEHMGQAVTQVAPLAQEAPSR